MQWSDLQLNPSRRTLVQFAALLCTACAAAAVVQAIDHRQVAAVSLAGLALVSALIGWFRPLLLRTVFVGWMAVAFPIGWTVSRLVLAVIFYGVFTPLGLLFRIVRRDPLTVRRSEGAATYWSGKAAADDPRAYFRQF
jgi:Saxitoxin biosynthesis operon protein SxtJ